MSRHQKHRAEDSNPAEAGEGGPGERLQKVLAAAGVGSRRDCEELIREGRVEVDKRVITELGTRVDALRHEIRVDGEALRKPKTLYYAVNKPVGVVTTNDDPDRRTRVVDLVPTEERVFAVGRLDRSSEGLILVTNDGAFANRITHPRYGVEKTYLVRVAGSPGSAELAKLQKGVYLSDGFCRVQSIMPKKRHKGSTDLLIVLNEGRNRELRRILARVGHKVLRLKRIAVGPIKLADLPVGNWRRLMPGEIDALLAVAKEKRREAKHKQRGPRPAKVGDSLRESPMSARGASGPPSQQQALMAEPLSLDDLLRDDLDEGNLAADRSSEAALAEAGSEYDFSPNDPAAMRSSRGQVLEYEPGAAPQEPAKPRRPFKKELHRGKRPEQRRQQPAPRPPHEGAAAAGKEGGNLHFRKKARVRPGSKAAGKTFGKPGGKAGGKQFGRKFGKPAGQAADKPGGRRGKRRK